MRWMCAYIQKPGEKSQMTQRASSAPWPPLMLSSRAPNFQGSLSVNLRIISVSSDILHELWENSMIQFLWLASIFREQIF